MMLHAHTCKRALLDRLSHLGISLSYDRVLQLLRWGKCLPTVSQRASGLPPTMRGQVFTTAAIDNIDHNPSTGITFSIPLLLVKELIEALSLLKDLCMQAPRTCHLPHYYTDVPPVTTSIKRSTVPATRLTSLDREDLKSRLQGVKRLHLNVQLCVSVKESAYRIEFRHSKQKSVENISHLIRTILFFRDWCK